MFNLLALPQSLLSVVLQLPYSTHCRCHMSTWPGICWLLVRQHGYWTGRRPAKPGAQSHCMCLSCSHSPSLQHPQHSWSTPTPPAGAHPSCNATGTASSWCCCSHLQAHIHNTHRHKMRNECCVFQVWSLERDVSDILDADLITNNSKKIIIIAGLNEY